jgi:hypothetical protein
MFNAKQWSRSGRGIPRRHTCPTKARRTTRSVATGAIIAASLLGAATSSAMADTSSLRLGCYVDSARVDVLQADSCVAEYPARQYTIVFEVLGRSGAAYTYNWHTSGTTPVQGCTSTYYGCTVSVRPFATWSRTVSVDVTELATGASKTVTAVAQGDPVCAWNGGLVWC